MSNNTFIKGILSANPFPSNIKGDFLLDLHLRELPSEQGKRFTLNQDKSLVNLQQRLSFIYGPHSKTGRALEAEKEALSNENSETNPEKEIPQITIPYLRTT